MVRYCVAIVALAGVATADYHNHDALTAALQELAAAKPNAVALEMLAETAEGRPVWLLTIAAGETPANERPALLLVGGVDAAYPAGSEIALGVAERLVAQVDQSEWLARYAVYVMPRLNPDGIERYFAALKHAAGGNQCPLDEDRDGVVDEDGPNDLNGDGLITVMRYPHADGVWMVDPDEPRLMKRVDRAKGERGNFHVVWEGRDDDGDGLLNEDGVGGVDLDRNFPHLYEPNPLVTGAHQLSEAATLAVARFVVEHPRVVAALVYGKYDNIVQVPKGKARDVTKRAYRELHPDDIARFEVLSGVFTETTGLKSSPGAEPAGALYSWLYSQRGIWTIATPGWEPAAEEAVSAEETVSATGSDARAEAAGDANMTADSEGSGDAVDPAVAAAERETGGAAEPRERAERPRGKRDRDEAVGIAGADGMEARFASSKGTRSWLKYSDAQRDGAGFVPWTKVEHPTLGTVEVGGFAPYFLTTAPVEVLANAAERQTKFVAALVERLPKLVLEPAEVKALDTDVFRVTVRVRNDGMLPTHGGIGDLIDLSPVTLRVDVPRARLLGGRPVERVGDVPGAGVVEQSWLVRGEPGSVVRVTAYQQRHGQWETHVELKEAVYPLQPADVEAKAEEK